MQEGIIRFEEQRLANIIHLEPNALKINGPVEYEDWEKAYNGCKKVAMGCPWWTGDALDQGEKRFGEQYSQALDQEDASTHMKYKRVCAEFPPDERRKSLTISHHIEVLSLDMLTKNKVLDIAVRDNLSVRELRKLIKATLGIVGPATDWYGKFTALVEKAEDEIDDEQYYKFMRNIREFVVGRIGES